MDGTVIDPTKDQFPSKGNGFYEPFDGLIDCSECGKTVKEEEICDFESNYAFCSYRCKGRFIGIF